MPESENKSSDHNAARPQRKKFRLRLLIGMLLMNFGVVFTTMMTMNHLKLQPPQPLGFDLTLRWGYGGYIAYGVTAAVLGFILICIEPRDRKEKFSWWC